MLDKSVEGGASGRVLFLGSAEGLDCNEGLGQLYRPNKRDVMENGSTRTGGEIWGCSKNLKSSLKEGGLLRSNKEARGEKALGKIRRRKE